MTGISKGTFKYDSLIEGEMKLYNESGKLRATIKRYSKDGKIYDQAETKYYNEDGEIEEIRKGTFNYKPDQWKEDFYDKNGELIKTEITKQGEIKTYDKEGKT